MRVILASAARIGSTFEQAWLVAATAALSYLSDDAAFARWAELRDEESSWASHLARLATGSEGRSERGS
jgi:hypothetical protein